MDRIVPAEQEALDRPWRKWASVAVGGFVVVSLIFGFLILPLGWRGGEDLGPFGAICRAIGIPGYGAKRAPSAPATPASQVAWTPDTRQVIAAAAIDRGAKIAADTCASCHGENGVSVDPTQFPNLAGEPVPGLFKQLSDYRSGSRPSDVMSPFAQALDEQQMADVAAYYASRPPVERLVAETGVDPAIARLARIGDPARAIPACDGCHGATRGGPVETPTLLSQPAVYLVGQLEAFAKGDRHNDLYQRMRAITGALKPEEMKALAVYYAGNPVPKYK